MEDSTLSRMRHWLNDAALTDGTRLPPERELADSLSVSRSSLRKALLVLEAQGQLERHVGRGTFFRDPGNPGLTDAGKLAVFARRTGPHEAMSARLALEPEIASLAAFHATPRQISDLWSLTRETRAVTDWETYEELDARFHDLIAQATGNPLLIEVSHIVNAVRRAVVWSRLFLPPDGPGADYHSFDEHEAVVAAMERRDRQGARTAMRRHIESTLSTMMAEA